jgi:hypothetical protein
VGIREGCAQVVFSASILARSRINQMAEIMAADMAPMTMAKLTTSRDDIWKPAPVVSAKANREDKPTSAVPVKTVPDISFLIARGRSMYIRNQILLSYCCESAFTGMSPSPRRLFDKTSPIPLAAPPNTKANHHVKTYRLRESR